MFVTLIMSTRILLLYLYIVPVLCQWNKYDYQAKSATTQPYGIINSVEGNGPSLSEGAMFGWSLANMGDIDGNGNDDLIVGAIGETCIYKANGSDVEVEQSRCGAVYILFMGENRTVVDRSVRITNLVNGGPRYLQANDNFGHGVSPAGDIDGDGVVDLAVGAPGTYAGGSLYIFFLNPNGTARDYTLIRGPTIGNGPPVKYMGRFASAIGYLGDMNNDGKDELAVQMADFAAGESKVFIMNFFPNGTVFSYRQLILKNPQGEIFVPPINSDFGYSISTVGDLNGDGVLDVAIGSPKYTDPKGVLGGGAVYVCIMNDTLEVFNFHILTDVSPEAAPNTPMVNRDACGTAVTSTGDINRDDLRARHPSKPRKPSDKKFGARSIDDIIVGCAQWDAEAGTGRWLIWLMGGNALPSEVVDSPFKYPERAPPLREQESFGAAMTYLGDMDKNGIPEFAVGAPGGKGQNPGTGSIYIIFLRRRYTHPRPFNWTIYWVKIIVPAFFVCLCCILSTIAFFIHFRRKPDEIELAVKKAGVEIGLQRKRERKVKPKTATIYADDFS